MSLAQSRPIILMTDFGYQDWFVGVMKGVIAAKCPSAVMIDLTHDIEPGNVRQGAFVLSVAFSEFPAESVFLCVVDPGVGSDRDAIAIWFADRWFVGPNNGLFSCFCQGAAEDFRCYRLAKSCAPTSNTFHGRDIFAPAAASLAAGVPIESLSDGPCDAIVLPVEFRTTGKNGEIQYFDRFGNAITTLSADPAAEPGGIIALTERDTRFPVHRSFSDAAIGEPLAYAGSCGLVELAVRDGNARSAFELELGMRVEWRR